MKSAAAADLVMACKTAAGFGVTSARAKCEQWRAMHNAARGSGAWVGLSHDFERRHSNRPQTVTVHLAEQFQSGR